MGLGGLVKGAVGGTLQGVGRVGTAIGIDDDRSLSSLGKDITNPNVNYLGAKNPAQATAKPVPTSTQKSTSGGGGNQSAQQSGAYSGDSGAYSAGAGSASSAQAAQDAAEKAAALYAIDQQLNGANEGLGRLDNQLNIGLGNIDRDFQSAYGQLIGQKQIGERNYGQNKTNQLNEYGAKRNENATQSRNFLDSSRRTLGANGAGGGSAARYALPFEAQQMASSANAADQQVNNRNITSIEQNWQDDLNEINNSETDLNRQRTQGQNDYRSKIEGSRADLLNQIASLTGQKTLANGGDYSAAMMAAQPYTSRISSILNTIDSLAATPAINARQVQLNAPDLSGYNWANQSAPVTPVQDATLAGNNVIQPYQDDQRNPLLSLFGLDEQYA